MPPGWRRRQHLALTKKNLRIQPGNDRLHITIRISPIPSALQYATARPENGIPTKLQLGMTVYPPTGHPSPESGGSGTNERPPNGAPGAAEPRASTGSIAALGTTTGEIRMGSSALLAETGTPTTSERQAEDGDEPEIIAQARAPAGSRSPNQHAGRGHRTYPGGNSDTAAHTALVAAPPVAGGGTVPRPRRRASAVGFGSPLRLAHAPRVPLPRPLTLPHRPTGEQPLTGKGTVKLDRASRA